MFSVRAGIESFLASASNLKFAAGKRDYFNGQTGNTSAANVLHQGIGTLAVGALAANTAGTVAVNDLSCTQISLLDAWLAEGTTTPAAGTRGRVTVTIRNIQATPGAGTQAQASSTTTVLNLPTSYAPVASALVGLSLFCITGPNAGTSQVISANTTTTITTAAFASTPAVGDIYKLGGAVVDVVNLAAATATLSTDYVLQYALYN